MVAITVGVACYNVEAWVEKCVVSLLGQTFKDFEIIAIDDGSTDRTGALLDSLAARDDRLRVIHQENAGLGPVKNNILREARGKFIAFVDGDDWIAPECLEEAYRCAIEDDLDVVAFGWVRIEDGTGRILARRDDHQERNVKDAEDMREAAFSARMNLMSCASLVRTSLFIENDLEFPSVGHEDIYVTPFLYFYGKRFGYVDQDLYYWRVREGAITQTISMFRVDGYLGIFESWKARLSRERRFEDYRGAVIAGFFAYLSSTHRQIAKQDGANVELLDYFRNQIRNLFLSVEELREYKKYLSILELRRYKDIISIIEQTPSERNERSRMIPTPEIPSVGRSLIRICRNRGVRSFVRRRLTSPTAVVLAAGLALTGAAHTGPVWSAWLSVSGLTLVCLVIVKESVLWRWRREGDLARFVSRLEWAKNRFSTERSRWERTLSEALSSERARSERALSVERNHRTLVDVHLADRDLPVRRILLLLSMHRSGSTWLFDLLRTHSAVRVEPTARVWTALGLDGWRYPSAFFHVDGASVPLEITPGLGAAIPAFPRVDIPGIDEADQWVLEKGHPEFVGFEANRLAARVGGLRDRGVEIEIIYGVRRPLDSMWSMAELKAREPSWYAKVPFNEVPRHTAQSLATLAEVRSLIGGTVVEYESLPDGLALRGLSRRLAPDWDETEIDRWLAHATAVTERAKRRQREDAGFLGDRDPLRDPDGPEGIWLSCAAEMEAAKATYRRLIAEDEAG